MTRSPATSTYDDDFFAWTQEQAAALRDMPKGAAGPFVDIEHVALEIEDLGKRDLREVNSFLTRFLEHLIKIDGAPASRDVLHWRGEARQFQQSAVDAFSPGMRRAIDLPLIWRRAVKRAKESLQEIGESPSAPVDCPLGLDDLLAEDLHLDEALLKLAGARS